MTDGLIAESQRFRDGLPRDQSGAAWALASDLMARLEDALTESLAALASAQAEIAQLREENRQVEAASKIIAELNSRLLPLIAINQKHARLIEQIRDLPRTFVGVTSDSYGANAINEDVVLASDLSALLGGAARDEQDETNG